MGSEPQTFRGDPKAADPAPTVEAPAFGELLAARFRTDSKEFDRLFAQFRQARGPVLDSWFGVRSRTAVVLTDVDRAAAEGVRALYIGTAGAPLHPAIDAALREVTTIQLASMLAVPGPARRLVSQSAFTIASSLLGVAESRAGGPRAAGVEADVERIRPEIDNLRAYVAQAGSRSATYRYLVGVIVAVVLALLAVLVAVATGVVLHKHPAIVAGLSGAVGATVSVVARYATSRRLLEPSLRRTLAALGATRVVLGAVFGFAVFLLLDSGVVAIRPTNGDLTSFYAVVGFFAGFAERLAPDLVASSPMPGGDAQDDLQLRESTARLLETVPAKLEDSVNEALADAIHGPPLANFKGYAWASIEADNVDVWLGPERPSDTEAFEVTIENGVDEAEVEFAVQLDSDHRRDLRWPQQIVRASPYGPAVGAIFALGRAAQDGEVRLWVRVTQRGRLIQIFELAGRG
jgi:hypothetical protein